jgi:hypothetical protein
MPSAIEEVKLWRRAGGGLPAQATYPEAASQSFKRGDFVYLASGKVTEAVAPGSDLIDSGNLAIGIAAADASGITDADCEVILLTEDLEICLPVTHATPASAITAITQVGTSYELENVTSKGYAVTEGTSNPVVKVVAISEQYPVGEQYGWVWVKFIAAERALN